MHEDFIPIYGSRGSRSTKEARGGGGGISWNCPRVQGGTTRNNSLPGTDLTNPPVEKVEFGASLAYHVVRVHAVPISVRGCFGDIPGDGIVECPPHPIR